MLKHKKKLIVFTSLMTLIPMFTGCILWTRLPDLIATHFGADNRPNGFSSKGFTVFGIPVLLVLMHLFLLFLASADPKAKNIGRKPFGILFWIFPLTSILTGFITYAIGLPFGRRFYRYSFCRDSLSRTRQLFSESPAELFLWHKNALDIKRQ